MSNTAPQPVPVNAKAPVQAPAKSFTDWAMI